MIAALSFAPSPRLVNLPEFSWTISDHWMTPSNTVLNPACSGSIVLCMFMIQEATRLQSLKLMNGAATLALGREFRRDAKLSAGFVRYTGEMDIAVGNPDIRPFSYDGAELFAELKYDRLDDRYLPTRGVYSTLKYTRFG